MLLYNSLLYPKNLDEESEENYDKGVIFIGDYQKQNSKGSFNSYLNPKQLTRNTTGISGGNENQDVELASQSRRTNKMKTMKTNSSFEMIHPLSTNKIWNKIDVSDIISFRTPLSYFSKKHSLYEGQIFELVNNKIISKYLVLYKDRSKLFRSKEAFLYNKNSLKDIYIGSIIECDLYFPDKNTQEYNLLKNQNSFILKYKEYKGEEEDQLNQIHNTKANDNNDNIINLKDIPEEKKPNVNKKGYISLIEEFKKEDQKDNVQIENTKNIAFYNRQDSLGNKIIFCHENKQIIFRWIKLINLLKANYDSKL